MRSERASDASSDLERTPLHDDHVALDARMVPFAGFTMPMHYKAGIREEHRAVRERAGVFDVSHMGEIEVSGPDALAFLQRLTLNDVARLSEGQAQYSAICREDGGILDDLLVYRFPDRYMVVVNATRRAADLAWLEGHRDGLDVEIRDLSDRTALLALQGPRAEKILAGLAGPEVREISYYRFRTGQVSGVPAVISRTGYTGEDGFELYVDPSRAPSVWAAILDAGSGEDVLPVGLGARDSLRLEMGYALYGQELDPEHTPLEARLGWITRLEKGEFVGRDALLRQREAGIERTLAGLFLEERGFPRTGYPIVRGEDVVGTVTSGTLSPTLERGIALGYVPVAHAETGSELAIRIRDRDVAARVDALPFHTGGSIKR